ncbi:Dipeptidyl aminopeptidase BI [Babesia sp. Xinjiang]|uniref:Dipeptidyl aminopeptidase BI n=1 Tax=Babesia sp. Xinjiang TaxID=462227 RepID=UPI000A260CF7|nr:Dipeptidyl aminopeptidase BI [Babesia sp. Xinjiang]ORM41486.1 Dipeptidyl aminopeptidase BI [Babesia sp. Xinjiang]
MLSQFDTRNGYVYRGDGKPFNEAGKDELGSCDPVSLQNDSKKAYIVAALENYRRKLAEESVEVERVRAAVRQESARLRGVAGSSLEYEIFGQHAYFEQYMCHAYNGQETTDENERLFLLRSKLPSHRRMNHKRPYTIQPSQADEKYIVSNARPILDFINIRDANGNLIDGIRSMRVGYLSRHRTVISLVHDNAQGGKDAHFVLVGREKVKKGYISTLKSSLSGVAELHFLPHGTTRDRRAARIFYTITDNTERAWQLRTAYVYPDRGIITNDRAVYTENDPTKYISLHKTKNGCMLFVGTVLHGRTFKVHCIRNDHKLKLYHMPLPNDKRLLLEHRGNYIYAIHSTVLPHRKDVIGNGCLDDSSCRKNDGASVQWAVSKLPSRVLKPVHRRRKETYGEVLDAVDHYNKGTAQWVSVGSIDNGVVTDMDMMHRGLVIYVAVPPSKPTILVKPFVSQVKHAHDHNMDKMICQLDPPISVGVIEPQSNSNYYANRVLVLVNSPGTTDIKCVIDLEEIAIRVRANDNGLIISRDEGLLGSTKTDEVALKTENRIVKIPSGIQYSHGYVPRSQCCICYVHSRDGSCQIPVTLVKASAERYADKQGESDISSFQKTGNKCVVYVYGAYGERLQVNNDIEHNTLLALGYTLCFAHVRGGGELGDTWHSGAVKYGKCNGFHDLVDVLEFLVARNIAQRNKLAIATTSAGGILAACVYNMRPDLCSSVLLKLPFLDVSDSVSDPAQALSQLELEEFGGFDYANMDYVYSYNPSSNPGAKAQAKPALIVQCNDQDSRAPWQHTTSFISQHSDHNKRIYLKISHGNHTDGTSLEEREELIIGRLSILESVLHGTDAHHGKCSYNDMLSP